MKLNLHALPKVLPKKKKLLLINLQLPPVKKLKL